MSLKKLFKAFKMFGPTGTDGYKQGHGPMYPDGSSFLYANSTARSDKIFARSPSCSSMWDRKILVTGHVAALHEIVSMWEESFFSKPKSDVLYKFKRRCDTYIGKDKVSAKSLANLHDIGHLPLRILGVEEGTRLPIGVPMYVIYDSNGNVIDEGSEFFWLAEFLETIMSNMTWKQVTVGTIAFEYRRVLTKWAKITGVPTDFVKFQAHDFSYRGMSGMEDGARCGAAHLRVFTGSDTMPAIDYIEQMYNGDAEKVMIAGTIPATEHSVATANILSRLRQMVKARRAEGATEEELLSELKGMRLEAERGFIKEMLTVKFKTGMLGLVCDSFDFFGVLTSVLPSLKEEILARLPDENGMAKLVIRPDSGDPVEIICGVEILDQLAAEAQMVNYKPEFVYFKDPEGKIHKATSIAGKAISRTISQVKADLPAVDHSYYDELMTDVMGSAALFDYPFPISADCTDPVRFKAYRELHDLLELRGVEVMVMGKGTYRNGYKIEQVELSAQEKGAIELLWETFGGTETERGYKVLHERIGLIYGDSITVHRAEEICRRLAIKGFASCNVVFGVGSYTYNYLTRDTFGIAVKATATMVNGEMVELYKDPATGDGLKKSAKGLLALIDSDEGIVLNQEQDMKIAEIHVKSGLLKPIFMDGGFVVDPNHTDICAKVDQHITETTDRWFELHGNSKVA